MQQTIDRNQTHDTASPHRNGLLGLLDKASERVSRLGSQFTADSHRLASLRERLQEERFHLAVLGQFKRGKSTLLNALLGDAVLPASVVPLTAIPTFLRPGPKMRAHVVYQNGHPEEDFATQHAEELSSYLARFVTEEANPRNRLGVSQVDVYHPSAILTNGLVLIDTPGIGSTFRHNTEATLNFLPQCDAALFLVSADPPITEVEVSFLKEIRSKVPRLFFILNKVDYLSEAERQTALSFFHKVLREQVGLEGEVPVFCVSARQGLEAKLGGDNVLWERSGLGVVQGHLIDFLAHEKRNALREAIARKAADFLEDILLRLRLAIRSLAMPLEDLEERLRIFGQKLKEADQQRILAGDLLVGDRKRLVEHLEERAEQLRRKARGYLRGIVRCFVEETPDHALDEQAAQEALAEAIPGFFEHEQGEMARAFESRVAEVLRPHQQRADELIESVRRTAAELFEIPYRAPDGSEAFKVKRQVSWRKYNWSSSFSLIPEGALDRLLPARVRRTRMTKRLYARIESLVISNVEDLRWSLLQNLDQTFRLFGMTLDERLKKTIAATHGAIQATLTRRKERAEAVADEVAQLEAVIEELTDMQRALHKGPISPDAGQEIQVAAANSRYATL